MTFFLFFTFSRSYYDVFQLPVLFEPTLSMSILSFRNDKNMETVRGDFPIFADNSSFVAKVDSSILCIISQWRNKFIVMA